MKNLTRQTRQKISIPYLKEKNILQLPIFYFGKTNLKSMVTEWEDENGKYALKCFCDYGLPGSFEQDVYAACMRIWVLQGMPDTGIELNYSDVARTLRLEPPKNWINKIKKALMRLGLARFEFQHCFVEAESKNTSIKQFSLFDTTNFFEHRKGRSKRNSNSKIYFPKEIQENLDEKYYQWLDMSWFRSLPNGLPRRLYEFLEKRRYHNINDVLTISEENICRWLPLKDKNTTTRRRTLAKTADSLIRVGYLSAYYFNRQKKLCSFTYGKMCKPLEEGSELVKLPLAGNSEEPKNLEIIQVSHDDKQGITMELQSLYFDALEWISSIPYFRKKRRREIASLPIYVVVKIFPKIKSMYEDMENKGKCPGADWIYHMFMEESGAGDSAKRHEEQGAQQMELFAQDEVVAQEENFAEIIKLIKLKRIPKALKTKVAEYHEVKGSEYVKWNILYANKHAKTNYSSYLNRALQENWAAMWAEEEQERITQKKEKQKIDKQNESRKIKQKEQLDSSKELFKTEVDKLSKRVKNRLWKESEAAVADDVVGRAMRVRIEYSKSLLEYINKKSEKEFPQKVVKELRFVSEIALK